jgi:hypothetical protein
MRCFFASALADTGRDSCSTRVLVLRALRASCELRHGRDARAYRRVWGSLWLPLCAKRLWL